MQKWVTGGIIIICLCVTGCFYCRTDLNMDTDDSIVEDGKVDYLPNQLLVKFKSGADIGVILYNINATIISYNPRLDYYIIRINSNNKSGLAAARRSLRKSNQALLIESNYFMKALTFPNDPGLTRQWGLYNINAVACWNIITGSDTIKIAILDTGIDHNHADLTGKVVSGYNAFTKTVGLPGDDSISGHGTHCAGIAAAIGNNAVGIAGVSWSCMLMAVKVLDANGNGSVAVISDGITWAVDNGADVISLSLGGEGYSRVLEDAIDYAVSKNVTVVAAAGNDTRFNDNRFPAALPGVIASGATGPDNNKASFSTETNHLFIAAPGEKIYSTLPNNQYGYLSGTSEAVPFIAGAVALIKSQFGKGLDINQIYSQLKRTAIDIGAPGWDQQTGWGLLDLQRALEALQTNEYGTAVVTVTDESGNAHPNSQVLLACDNGHGIAKVLTDQNGKAYFWGLAVGSYYASVEKLGYKNTVTVTITAGSTADTMVSLPIPAPVPFGSFNEDAENVSPLVIAEGYWAKTDLAYHTPIHCWTDSPGINYADDVDMSLVTLPFSLVGSISPCLKFYHKYVTEQYCDWCDVDISTDYGETWAGLESYSGVMDSWQQVIIDLAGYKNEPQVLIRFHFYSDFSNNDDGWYIDDIQIGEP